MKEITLRMNDELAQLVENLAAHVPDMEVVESTEMLDANDDYDLCFKAAIESLRNNHVIRYPRDYAWIMIGIEQDFDNDFRAFSSTRGFIGYLSILGIFRLPSNTALYNATKLVDGVYPEWEFMDAPDVNEKRRRKEVFQLFLIAFNKAKRQVLNNKVNKWP